MTLGILSCLANPTHLAKILINLLFLATTEELSTDQSDCAMALIRLMELLLYLFQRRASVNLYWIGQTLLKLMIFLHCVKFKTIVRKDKSVLLPSHMSS